ncbi:MAG TPA: CD225/dispanin family protein [Pirellula sp.]|nr:CD225/dispanin family protein [Pirellula sp.]
MSSGMQPNPYGDPSVQGGVGFGAQANVPNYLVQSILVTLCCCIPFGIVAIVYAAQVNAKLAANNVAGAQESSQNAKKWCWIGFGSGLVINLIVFAIQILAAVATQQQGVQGM